MSRRRWSSVDLDCAAPEDAPAAFAAAYLASETAYVEIARRAGGLTIRFTPKAPGGKKSQDAVAEDIRDAFAAMRGRWALTLANRGVREEIRKRALAGPGPAAPAAPPTLSKEQQAEIAAILKEAEESPFVDEESVSTPWSELERGDR